jgi:hypothetical protein
VWFIYPETANVRLEDMNMIFGDATSVVPTPETLAEAESLFSGRSPVPSLDLRRQTGITADHAIPGLDINPPSVGGTAFRPSLSRHSSSGNHSGEGLGGWISNMTSRLRGGGGGTDSNGEGSSGAHYKSLNQNEEE